AFCTLDVRSNRIWESMREPKRASIHAISGSATLLTTTRFNCSLDAAYSFCLRTWKEDPARSQKPSCVEYRSCVRTFPETVACSDRPIRASIRYKTHRVLPDFSNSRKWTRSFFPVCVNAWTYWRLDSRLLKSWQGGTAYWTKLFNRSVRPVPRGFHDVSKIAF